MKGITELSSLLPVMFTARNAADDAYRRGDTSHLKRYVARAIGHLGDMSLSSECKHFLSSPFTFQVSVRACCLRYVAYTNGRPYLTCGRRCAKASSEYSTEQNIDTGITSPCILRNNSALKKNPR